MSVDIRLNDTENIRDAILGFGRYLEKIQPPPPPPPEPSPFQEYADREGFLLSHVQASYQLLSGIDVRIPNYYELCEKKAKKQPELTADLYSYLRQGMDLTPEEFLETHNSLDGILID